MPRTRRLIGTFFATSVLLMFVAWQLTNPANGQFAPAQPVPGFQPAPFPGQPDDLPEDPVNKDGNSVHYGAITLHGNVTFQQFLDVARDCIKDEAWQDAAKALHTILTNDEDFYVRVEEHDPTTGHLVHRWTSVKYEANKLLGTMPEKGLKVYRGIYGRLAEIKLDEAKKKGDIQLLGQVAQQFFHTQSGREANDLLATYFLDRGQFFVASLQFDRLLALSSPQEPADPLILFKAALAFRRAGDVKKADAAWKKLLTHMEGQGGLRLNGNLVPTEKLQTVLNSMPRPQSVNPLDWALIRGNLSNTAQSYGSPPLLGEMLWSRPTVQDKDDFTGDVDPGAAVPGLIASARQKIQSLPGVPVMPGFFPAAVDGKLLYRTYNGLAAINLSDVQTADGKLKAGTRIWTAIGFEGSLAQALNNSLARDKLISWVSELQGSQNSFFSNFIYENSLVGTLTADSKNVYAVDDVAVPVPPQQVMQVFGSNGIGFNEEIRKLVTSNSLQAYTVKTGKFLWALGMGDTRKHGDFEESHFLGPPLPVGGKLYALNEKINGDLRLITIDPANGEVVQPIQNLGNVELYARFARDPNRRVHGVHLAYGEGILVCPTNAGQILGVDLLSRSLAWAYPYREGKREGAVNLGNQPGLPFPNQNSYIPLTAATWKVAPPAISKGKVVFTAPDAKSLHCINLRDGTMVWKRAKNESDVFLAGVWNRSVVIVGVNLCYALDLNDGSILWQVTTGAMPSGQGVASDDIYYLPLENGVICAIDVKQGRIKARNRPVSSDAPVPGNLVFHEGKVISQTLDQIVVYPQLNTRLKEAETFVKNNPNDLEKRFYLGELRLASGKVHAAVEAFHSVKNSNPPAALENKLQQKLYESLSDLFHVDFPTANAKYLSEYEKLCDAPADATERQQRKGQFYRLLGNGLEAQGDLVGAFVAYRQFGSLPLYQNDGIPAIDDPLRKTPATVWLRGRLNSMFAAAPANKRVLLENKIEEEWNKVKNKNDLNEIRSFVAMFSPSFNVGRQARLELANSIIDNDNSAAFLEAELQLEQLLAGQLGESPDPGGKALEALARLAVQKKDVNSMKLAVEYYRKIAKQFPDVAIRNGQTGKQIYDRLTTNKLLLPYLSEPTSIWKKTQLTVRELPPGSKGANLTGFVLRPKGDLNTNTSQIRLVVDPISSAPRLHFFDLSTNRDIRTVQLDSESTNNAYFSFLNKQISNNPDVYPNAHIRFSQTKGHLAVIQVGTMAYAVDLNKCEVRWKHSLVGSALKPGHYKQQVMPDQHGHLVMTLSYNNPRRTVAVRVGYVAAVEASYVCLIEQDTLRVIDPLSDMSKVKELWNRPNISEDTEVFGDDRFIYMVDVVNGKAIRGRALRVADGAPVNIPDFSGIYQRRLHVADGRILAKDFDAKGKLVVRLYDIAAGKDVWRGVYHPNANVLKTLDPNLTGVLEPDGKMTIVDLKAQKIILQTNVLAYRVSQADLKNLDRPLLLVDHDHYYLALNKSINPNEVRGSQLNSNFGNGLDCEVVNGWFGAFHRRAGSKQVNGKMKTWKAGDLHWYSSEPVTNQLVVVDQFDKLPVVLFSVRYHPVQKGPIPANQWISKTQSLDKATGKWVYFPFNPRLTNGVSPRFQVLEIDAGQRMVNLIGFNGVLQHYDPGKAGVKTGQNTPGEGGKAGGIAVGGAANVPPVVIDKPGRIPVKLNQPGQPDVIIKRPGQPPIIIRPGNPPLILREGRQPVPLNQPRIDLPNKR